MCNNICIEKLIILLFIYFIAHKHLNLWHCTGHLEQNDTSSKLSAMFAELKSFLLIVTSCEEAESEQNYHFENSYLHFHFK